MKDFAENIFNDVLCSVFGNQSVANWNTSWGDPWWSVVSPYNETNGNKTSTEYNQETTLPIKTFFYASKLPNELVSSQFPPSDVLIDKDKNLIININAAGYKKENITIRQACDENGIEEDKIEVIFKSNSCLEYEKKNKDNNISLKEIKNQETEDYNGEVEQKEEVVYLQKGIKMPFKSSICFYVDPRKFDISTLKANLADGTLNLTISRNKQVRKLGEIEISQSNE